MKQCLNMNLNQAILHLEKPDSNLNKFSTDLSKEPWLNSYKKNTYKINSGKVRDCFFVNDYIYLNHSDRLSAFDSFVGYIPFKGVMLTAINNYWLKKAQEHNIPTCPFKQIDSRTIRMKKLKPFKIEIILRNFLAGSLLKSYKKGKRVFWNQTIPNDMQDYEKLPYPMITPTTKAEQGTHDLPITKDEIIANNICSKNQWEQIEKTALQLFNLGSDIYEKKGWILVDTKYEFAKSENGDIFVIDEIHTPDSSRLWKKSSYEEKMGKKQQPDMFDKEIIRAYLQKQGFSETKNIPDIPRAKIIETLKAYQTICNILIEDSISVDFSLEKFSKILQEKSLLR